MHHAKHHHAKHHHAKEIPVTGDKKRRGCFLFLLSAAIVLLFIVLPFWLLYKRSITPPAPEAFGPAAPAEPAKPAPERMRQPPGPSDDEDDTVRFK